jgi:hypothetical protein
MKIREVAQLTRPNLPRTPRSVAADQTPRTAVPVRIVGQQKRSGSEDIFVVADPTDEVAGELSRAPEISRMGVPTPHSRDVEFIKAQIARLPNQTEQ